MSDFQLQVIQTVVFFLGLMGVAFAGWQLFLWIKWNRVQIVLTLDGRWETEPVVQARKDTFRKTGEIRSSLKGQGLPDIEVEEKIPQEFHTYLALLKQNSLDDYLVYMSVPNFFESVGAIAHRQDAYKLWGEAVVDYYKWFKVHIETRAKAEKSPQMYKFFTELAKWCEEQSKTGFK